MFNLITVRSRVVIAAYLTQAIIIGGMFSYGVFFADLEAELGWSRTQLSSASSIAFLVMGLLAVVGGQISDRYGPRWVLSATGLLSGLGYVLMSQMQSPWQLLVFFGVMTGIGLSTHDVVTLSTVAAWFDKKRGIMTGVVKTGAATGQVLAPLVVTALIAWLGWRHALVAMGIFMAISLVMVAQLMNRPDAKPRSKTVISSSDAQVSAPRGLTFREATRTRNLWTLCAIQFCFFPALFSIPVHIVSHSLDFGLTREMSAAVLSLVGASSIIGRLLVGTFLDQYGGRLALMACLFPLLLALLSLLIINKSEWLFLFAVFYGIAHGGLFTVVSPTVAEYFGMKAHGAIFGIILLFGVLSGACGPLLTGYIYDLNGNYELAFISLALLIFCGLILAMTLRPGLVRPE